MEGPALSSSRRHRACQILKAFPYAAAPRYLPHLTARDTTPSITKRGHWYYEARPLDLTGRGGIVGGLAHSPAQPEKRELRPTVRLCEDARRSEVEQGKHGSQIHEVSALEAAKLLSTTADPIESPNAFTVVRNRSSNHSTEKNKANVLEG